MADSLTRPQSVLEWLRAMYTLRVAPVPVGSPPASGAPIYEAVPSDPQKVDRILPTTLNVDRVWGFVGEVESLIAHDRRVVADLTAIQDLFAEGAIQVIVGSSDPEAVRKARKALRILGVEDDE